MALALTAGGCPERRAEAPATIGSASVGEATATAPPKVDPLPQERLDLILTSEEPDSPWQMAVAAAQTAHPEATVERFDPERLDALTGQLRRSTPRYLMLVMPPNRIDVNFAWRLLDALSCVDDDPFVDVCYGVITGATPEDAAALVERGRVAREKPPEPRLLDNLGPNTMLSGSEVQAGAFWRTDWLDGRLVCDGISHGMAGFPDAELPRFSSYGYLHFGGHGHPDRVDDGITAQQVAGLSLSPCVVFNGACSTGVTSRAFQPASDGTWVEVPYLARQLFCLEMLKQPVIAYLAAIHPDHGVPVYQEMEYLFTTGGTLGEVMKHTYDQVVMGNGGGRLNVVRVVSGQPLPFSEPSELMLYGTAARLLFGDPTLRVTPKLHEPPLAAEVADIPDGTVRVTLRVEDPEIPFSLMDTFHCDLAAQTMGFNDRLYATVPWGVRAGPTAASVEAVVGAETARTRLVGQAVEEIGGQRLLHVQVDVESTGYQQGPIRTAGASVTVMMAPPGTTPSGP